MKDYCEKNVRALLPSSVGLTFYEEIGSTNQEALKESTAVKAPHLFLAKAQTGGRGRLGRSFYSRGGLYMSVLLSADAVFIPPMLLTTAAACAVSRAVKEVCGISLGIKWVNDLYYEEKKVCGILTEAVTDPAAGKITAYVVGVGLNVGPSEFPPELREIAASLPGETDKNALAAEITESLLTAVTQSPDELVAYATKKSVVLGKSIRYYSADGTLAGEGKARSLGPMGELIVGSEDGGTVSLSGGEISVRPVR